MRNAASREPQVLRGTPVPAQAQNEGYTEKVLAASFVACCHPKHLGRDAPKQLRYFRESPGRGLACRAGGETRCAESRAWLLRNEALDAAFPPAEGLRPRSKQLHDKSDRRFHPGAT